jgi:hypothetical protein
MKEVWQPKPPQYSCVQSRVASYESAKRDLLYSSILATARDSRLGTRVS